KRHWACGNSNAIGKGLPPASASTTIFPTSRPNSRRARSRPGRPSNAERSRGNEDPMPSTKAEPGKTRIGWIGTGVMGRWMCQHLISKGYAATVYNRGREKAKPLLEAGATWGDTPRAVAERSDYVFAIVGFPRD